ncbi:hypothetical protein FOMPIDRAFT_90530 [Fomitopsis schrenkii]|uniref:Uncharacterized protein n=1 Tax=Fomitopsis schrenkii TaxID=2126942 RepID=S8F1U0_FOMSC|nr:hypothetical protein FOMPIDRAFT_90530 [Fomitopsis schrenkii]
MAGRDEVDFDVLSVPEDDGIHATTILSYAVLLERAANLANSKSVCQYDMQCGQIFVVCVAWAHSAPLFEGLEDEPEAGVIYHNRGDTPRKRLDWSDNSLTRCTSYLRSKQPERPNGLHLGEMIEEVRFVE